MIEKLYSLRIVYKGVKFMNSCSCGRSPIDTCVGWGNLNEDEYLLSSILWAKKKLRETDKAMVHKPVKK